MKLVPPLYMCVFWVGNQCHTITNDCIMMRISQIWIPRMKMGTQRYTWRRRETTRKLWACCFVWASIPRQWMKKATRWSIWPWDPDTLKHLTCVFLFDFFADHFQCFFKQLSCRVSQILLTKPTVDINAPGWNGETPFHVGHDDLFWKI